MFIMASQLMLLLGILSFIAQGTCRISKVATENFQPNHVEEYPFTTGNPRLHAVQGEEFSRPNEKRSVRRSSGVGECPHGYNWKEDVNGYCYWETSYETNKLSWKDSREYCKSYGGDLASFHSVHEEVIGLSFQYGSMEHPYWIGLAYNDTTHSFTWADGSPLDYINWANNEPHKDRLRKGSCAQMNAMENHWITAYCGQLSWFICKAPKMVNLPLPMPPSPVPLQTCGEDSESFSFEDACYYVGTRALTWQRAEIYCATFGAWLVSIHSENEVNFLLRLLEARKNNSTHNHYWIGFKSHLLHGLFKWSDSSVINFSNWDIDEPKIMVEPSQCASMHVETAFWSNNECDLPMNFICKKSSSSPQITITTESTTPTPGNCRYNWYEFNDKCYKVFGVYNSSRESWHSARQTCRQEEATLAIIQDANEQAFMTYLLQNAKADAWIGLHDRFVDGFFQWVDSDAHLSFSMFARGEPSRTEHEEDCVYMEYNNTVSGLWKDTDCETELPFICMSMKDPTVATEPVPRAAICPYPSGWLRQDSSCYKFFNDLKTYQQANQTCAAYHAHLVAVMDFTSEAVAKFLSISTNPKSSFWIGLNFTDDYSLKWDNGWPVTLSRWDKKEPNLKHKASCFVTDSSGLWAASDCNEKLPFICQVVSGKPPVPIRNCGKCPENWIEIGDNCFKVYSNLTLTMAKAAIRCYYEGANLASIHSVSEVTTLKKLLTFRNTTYSIGLIRGEENGFMWSDGSAIDFIYWDQGEPNPSLEFGCVDILPETLKWRVVSCFLDRNFICRKKRAVSDSNEANFAASNNCNNPTSDFQVGLSSGSLAAIIISLLILGVLIGVGVYFLSSWKAGLRLYATKTVTTVAFENALYDTHVSEQTLDTHSATLYVADNNE